MKNKLLPAIVVGLILFLSSLCALGVTSAIVRHSSSSDFAKGKAERVIIGSEGTLQLGRASEVLVDKLPDVWAVNALVASGGTIYLGTSPNGQIYSYSLGQLQQIYPAPSQQQDQEKKTAQDAPAEANQPGESNDANTVSAKQHLTNEHIFAMATDVAGRLLAGISGEKCRLVRYQAGTFRTIFEPNDATYIFAIALGKDGDIYLGTGPEGKIYRLDSLGNGGEVFYDSQDKNILSLAVGADGALYAGSDTRGLIYRIDPATKKAAVLYDSEQPEITALLFGDDGGLYAAATSAQVVETQEKFASQLRLAGRPETKTTQKQDTGKSEGLRKLNIPNTDKGSSDKRPRRPTPPTKPRRPTKVSHLFKVTREGYVTDVFNEAAVFFCLAQSRGQLLLGTGNSGRLFAVDPSAELQTVLYEDEQASQVTAVLVVDDQVYLGTANPAKLIRLDRRFAQAGTYTSDLIDASQPARWGKLQVEAEVPAGCKILLACRSGNVKDVNDPTFSDWSAPQELTGPAQLQCPLGRFCQYKLVLKTADGKSTPLIREVAVAHTVPNLAPKVESVTISRVPSEAKKGFFKISYKARDDNKDKLIYKIEFRKLGRSAWIELKDKLEADSFEWDGKTVEDGRYEIRITASDEPDNDAATQLVGTRISDPFIVDNTGPEIKDYRLENSRNKPVKLTFRVIDEFSAIGKVQFTIDSNADWKSVMPEDLVYDTTDEKFTVLVDKLEPGQHIISLKATDDAGNTTYKTFELTRAAR